MTTRKGDDAASVDGVEESVRNFPYGLMKVISVPSRKVVVHELKGQVTLPEQ